MDYKYYAIEFCRKLQKLEKGNEDVISVNDIKLIRRFKTQLGYAVPKSIEEGTGSLISESGKY